MDLAVPTLPAISETVVRPLASTKLQGYEYLCWYMAILLLFVTLVVATVLKSREKPDETEADQPPSYTYAVGMARC